MEPRGKSTRIPTVLIGIATAALLVDIVLRWQIYKRTQPGTLSAAASAATLGEPEKPESPAPAPTALTPPAPWPTAAPATPVVLLDGMSRSDNGVDGAGLEGYWYTYSDGTGSVEPPPGSSNLAPVLFDGRRAREMSGGAQEKWGAGLGFDISRSGPKANAKGEFRALDASAYAGIQFEVYSKSAPVQLRVSFPDADTDPRGGVCDGKSTISTTACFGDFGVDLDVAQGVWTERRVAFSQTSVPAWSTLKAAAEHGLRKNALYSVHFAVRPDQGKMRPFDVLVANIFFFL